MSLLAHTFKAHPLSKDFCTKSILVARAVHAPGLTWPAEYRYCGEAAEKHAARKVTAKSRKGRGK